jgi:hypothetical protein
MLASVLFFILAFTLTGNKDIDPINRDPTLGKASLRATPSFFQSFSDTSIRFTSETIKAERPVHTNALTSCLPPPSWPATMSSQSEKAIRRHKFEHVFTVIRDELVEHFKQQGMPNDAVQWYRRVSASLVLTPPYQQYFVLSSWHAESGL